MVMLFGGKERLEQGREGERGRGEEEQEEAEENQQHQEEEEEEEKPGFWSSVQKGRSRWRAADADEQSGAFTNCGVYTGGRWSGLWGWWVCRVGIVGGWARRCGRE